MAEAFIELGLTDHHGMALLPGHTSSLAGLLDSLLALAAQMAIAGSHSKTGSFRAEVEGMRARVAAAFSQGHVEPLAGECLALCRKYFEHSRACLQEREKEFAEVIAVLHQAIEEIAREAGAFHTRLESTSERFFRMAAINDLRVLKRQVVQEVQDLKQIIQEKKKQDEATYARLSQRVAGLSSQLQQVQEEAALDPLTQVANRGSFDRTVRRWVEVHHQNGRPFVLGMLDLDDFKRINDVHGHPVGDRVLTTAAEQLGRHIRRTDFLARYGGEEFALLLADLRLAQAKAKMADLIKQIAASSFQYKREGLSCAVRFTLSCGLAELRPNETVEKLIARADQALYHAKKQGKNCVVSEARSFFEKLLNPASGRKPRA